MDDSNAPDDALRLPDAVLAAAEAALNAALALDAEGAARLADLQGRVLLLVLAGFGTRVYVIPSESGLMLFGDYEAEPDCVVRGTPAALLRMALSEHREDSVFEGEIDIDGDNALAQRLGEILRGLDIDWEEHVSHLVGDTLAHQLGRRARAAGRWARRSAGIFRQDLREYLQEEGRFLPTHEELRGFLDEVDTVRDDVERLDARIRRLAKVRGK
ncbi:MAG: SCP2 sterol-binding domain-containing protein [Thiohalocapsa sp.]|nr:SCP2 sterol-binding domain-containing protein [Thiohalocapsa sp.]MCF7990836.1 SCP2 sterol-binding domain-containing protein [Thiohalocapsa sp.]